MTKEPLYYADGAGVFKSPVENVKADGSKSVTMGFRVCTCHDSASARLLARILLEHGAYEVAFARADRLIDAMSPYIGKMAVPAARLADLNEHFIFSERSKARQRVDVSDIPEVGEEWFRNAKLKGPEPK